jgi:hypothetical protein
VHERLVKEYGPTINHQWVKLHPQEVWPGIADELGIEARELAGMPRCFKAAPGARGARSVDWGTRARSSRASASPSALTHAPSMSNNLDGCARSPRTGVQPYPGATASQVKVTRPS